MCYFVLAAQGLIQLCVIVEKDGLGYGLTVSGDKPVHVQSVKESKWWYVDTLTYDAVCRVHVPPTIPYTVTSTRKI